ncbi:hypothetical protein ACOSQ3_021620 [Xanthoceras sorbifolium]
MMKRLSFLATIDTAANKRDDAIHEKYVVAKEREALRKRVATLKAEKAAISAKKDKTISSLTTQFYESIKGQDEVKRHLYVNGIRDGHAFFKDDVAPKLSGKLEKPILVNKKEGNETLAKKKKLW